MFSYDFDWSVLWRHPYGEWMLKGIFTTLHLSLLAWMIALMLGLIVGVFRVLPNKPTRFIGTAYVELIRNTPYLVQLFFWYFAVPLLLPQSAQKWLYDSVPNLPYWTGVICLGVYTASRVGEQLRAGMMSISRDQYQAAYSTGLTTYQTYRYVIIPYAIRIIIPPFTTEFLTCFKNSALTMTIGVTETTGAAYLIDSYTWHGLETTTAASVVYIVISMTVVLFMALVEKRIYMPGMITRRR
ncbi:MAG: amino acid ABC transporter permease [Deltaproteobacteria bacterium]|nr:amino acid ABC transporter permease [Deltaproteobacteria bacterium]MBW2306994.1 amino acid ABC transporter permease [Deltaproteobacteria bacterium]